MHREEIIRAILEFMENSNIDIDSEIYKRVQIALFCIESNDIQD